VWKPLYKMLFMLVLLMIAIRCLLFVQLGRCTYTDSCHCDLDILVIYAIDRHTSKWSGCCHEANC
jgi:hypothetical protein